MIVTYEIHGTLYGDLWWGGPASKDVSFRFTRTATDLPWTDQADTLREAIEGLMRREDGDFQDAARIDGQLLILRTTGRHNGRTEVRRWFDLASFPSIEDYVLRPEEVLA